MIVKLLTEHQLVFLSLKGACRGSSESTLVKMSNCWKSHAAAQILSVYRCTPRHYNMDVYWTVGYQSGLLLSFVHCCWVNFHHPSVFVKLFYKFLKKRRKKYHVFENSMENGAFIFHSIFKSFQNLT